MHYKVERGLYLQHELVLVHVVVLGLPVAQPVREARHASALVGTHLAVALAAHVACSGTSVAWSGCTAVWHV